MQTGKLDIDSFSQLLRGISQRRKQGALEITLGENIRTVYFISGKIVEVRDGEENNEAKEISDLLFSAGAIDKLPEDVSTYTAVYDQIEAFVPKDVFERAILHRVLDKLYEIDLKQSAYYSFSVQMVDVDRDYTPAISVGSFLLDLVSLDEQQQRVINFIGDDEISRANKEPLDTLSDKELLVWEYIEEPVSLEVLKQKTMLSSFAINETLLNLLDKAEIFAGDLKQSDMGSVENIVSALDQAADSSSGQEEEQEQEEKEEQEASESVKTPEQAVKEFKKEPVAKEVKKEKPLSTKKNKIKSKEPKTQSLSLVFSLSLLLLSVLLPAFLWSDIWNNF